jgi:hypothetical protein
MIDLSGHATMRYITRPVINKYVAEVQNEYSSKKKKLLDDYLIQKNYLKLKKGEK